MLEKRFQAFADIGFVVDDEDFASVGGRTGWSDQAFTGFLAEQRELQMEQCTSAGLALRLRSSHHAPERCRR